MLIGIDPVLNADVLYVLAAMGHGDELVICDGNFPAASVAARTAQKSPIRLGVDAITALRAVLSVFPIDNYDLKNPPVRAMQVVGEADTVPEIVANAQPLFSNHGHSIISIERYAFYEAATKAFAVIHTLEMQPYGNFIIRKGVVLEQR